MLERGANVVKLRTRPMGNDREKRRRDARPPSPFDVPPHLDPALIRSSVPSPKHTRGHAGTYDLFRDSSESSLLLHQDEGDSSHECLFPPTQYTSCSSGSIAGPAELKLQEFAQELARLKAQRKDAVKRQIRSEVDLHASVNVTKRTEALQSLASTPSSPCFTDLHESAKTLSAGSSEENLAYVDACCDALDDDSSLDTSKDEFRATRDTTGSKSMDFSVLHSVYRTKETHEEALLVRMKYAGDAYGRVEHAKDQESTHTDSTRSFLRNEARCQSPSGSFNAEHIQECTDMIRETLRKCTAVPPGKDCREIRRLSPTLETESSSVLTLTEAPHVAMPLELESDISTPPRHCSVSVPLPPLLSKASSRSSETSLAPTSGTSQSSQAALPSSLSSRHSFSEATLLSPKVMLMRPTSSWFLPPPPSQSAVTLPPSEASSSRSSSSAPTKNTSQSHLPSSSVSAHLRSSSPTETPNKLDKSESEFPPSEYTTDEDDVSWTRHSCLQDKNNSENILMALPITIDGRVIFPETVFSGDGNLQDYAGIAMSDSTPFDGLCEKLRSFAEGCGLHFIEEKDAVPGKNPSKRLVDPEGICTSEELNAALLARLACVKCSAICAPPVVFCSWGHAVCERCRPASASASASASAYPWGEESCRCRRRALCPHCSSEMQRKPCALWTYIAKSLLYPCRYWTYGCQNANGMNCDEKAAHERNCPFRQQRCWAAGCDWQGAWHQLRQHVQRIHQNDIIRAAWYRFVDVTSPPCVRSSNAIALPPDEMVLLHSSSAPGERRYILQHLRAGGPDGAVVVPRFRLRVASADGRSGVEVRGEGVDTTHDVDAALRTGRCFRICAAPFGDSPSQLGCVQICLEKGRSSGLTQ